MKFSIIVPFYNGLNYVNRFFETLDDYLNKEDCEVIIVDDYSNEETFIFLENYVNKRNIDNVHLIRNEKNGGAAYSRQKGVEIARGEYIAFLDADDGWVKDRAYIIYDYMKLHSINLIGGATKVIDKSDFSKLRKQNFDLKEISIKKTSFKRFLFKNYFSTPTVMVKRSIFLSEGFDTTMRYSEDFECWRRIVRLGKAYTLQESGTFSFKHAFISSEFGSLSSNSLKMSKGELEGLVKLFENSTISVFDKALIPSAITYSFTKAIIREIRMKIKL